MVKCSKCTVFACEHPQRAQVTSKLDFCPMNTEKDILGKAREEYEKPDVGRLARASALVESEGYMKWTRVEDTMEFAKGMNFAKLGVACCVGLAEEGRILTDILESNGFKVTFVFCKTGGVPKEELGLKDTEKVRPGNFEPICNPVAQALIMNKAKTELNIIVGLCVGHDSTFIKYSKAPVTVLIAKDRVLCHNPVGALYTAKGYYKHKLYEAHRARTRSTRAKVKL
jgi:uncharacterized metal-binding protein